MAPDERPVSLPADFTLRFAPDLRRPRSNVLIGGAPIRVLKLTSAGADRIDGWMAGEPVGPGRAAGELAARLVDAGLAWPVPPATSETPAPAVAVIVPVRDDPVGLAVTLAALASTAEAVPVCVVDDGSAGPVDGAAVRREAAGGPAAARNAGARVMAERAEVLVFVDAGCVPEGEWLAILLAHFADPGLAAVAPRIRSRPGPGTPPLLARYEAVRSPLDMGLDAAPVHPGSTVPYVPSAVLAVRTRAWAEMEGFDESRRFGEDVDLVWRLGGAGWRVRYEPAAVATHPSRASHKKWLAQRFDYGSSAAPLAARHDRAVGPLWASPWSTVAWAFAAGGHPEAGALIAAGSARALARRAGGDPEVARELQGLAFRGTVRAAGPIASAIRRAWLPPALVVAAAAWQVAGRQARWSMVTAGVAVLAGPGLTDWAQAGRRTDGGPGPGALAWAGMCLADDLAYQAGVWAGVIRQRSAAALLPKW
jgi:mycofactocin glycosyltransferase